MRYLRLARFARKPFRRAYDGVCGAGLKAGATMRYSFKLLSEICELLFQIRDFFLEGGYIIFQPGNLLPHG